MINRYIIPLENVEQDSLIGNKGATLRFLVRNGVNVPPTHCVTINAYNDFIEENNLRISIADILASTSISTADIARQIKALILSHTISQNLMTELIENHFDTGQWAIRSSANMEDLSEASFAGMYDSYIDVSGIDNIKTAIQKCWTSLWNERAIEYRHKYKLGQHQIDIAVLLQQMIYPVYSGVLFTKNPLTEDDSELVIEYSTGIGTDLVSGKIIPTTLVLNRSGKFIRHLNNSENNDFKRRDQKKLVRTALSIEEFLGYSQDIEWAFDGKKIYILQSRPISKTSGDSKIEDTNYWTRANIGEVLPNVVTPMTWSIFRATLMGDPHLAFEDFNNQEQHKNGTRLVRGRAYVHLRNLLNSFSYLPKVTPLIMSRVLGVKIPELMQYYRHPKGITVTLAQILFLLDCFGMSNRIQRLFQRLPAPPHADHTQIRQLIKWNAHCFKIHLKSTAYTIGAFGLLSHYLNRWLPERADDILPELLIGNQQFQTSQQGKDLWKLADLIRNNADLKNLLSAHRKWSEILPRLNPITGGVQFSIAFRKYIEENGARTIGEFELSIPRWSEEPTFLLDMLRKYIETESLNSSRSEKNQQFIIDQIKCMLTPFQLRVLTRLLNSFYRYTSLREDIKYRLIQGYALLRQAIMEIGANLVIKGHLKLVEDVFFLTPAEVLALEHESDSIESILVQLNERKEQHALWESLGAADLIDENGRTVITHQSHRLTGIGCSPGIAEGQARVLYDPMEAHDLRPGEILVTPHTDPGWTPLFLSCKAVVTEIGGFLSHGATVAREFGIPAIFNVDGLTHKIHTGDLIRVNGSKGLIEILKRKK